MVVLGKRRTPIDWKVYNKELVRRGRRLAEGITEMKRKVLKFWDYELAKMNKGKQGRQFLYPDSQIVFLAIVKDALDAFPTGTSRGSQTSSSKKCPSIRRSTRG